VAPGTRAIWLLPFVMFGVLVAGCAADRLGVAVVAAVAPPASGFHVSLATDDRPTTRATARRRLETTELVVVRLKSVHRRAIAAKAFTPVPVDATDGGFVCQLDMS
jgi:hypothetical protein